jgi:hypothetical protein
MRPSPLQLCISPEECVELRRIIRRPKQSKVMAKTEAEIKGAAA